MLLVLALLFQVTLVSASQPVIQQQSVQTFDLVTALQQNPQLQKQLQQQLAANTNQASQVNAAVLAVNNLSPAPSPPVTAAVSPPIQAVSPPLSTVSNKLLRLVLTHRTSSQR